MYQHAYGVRNPMHGTLNIQKHVQRSWISQERFIECSVDKIMKTELSIGIRYLRSEARNPRPPRLCIWQAPLVCQFFLLLGMARPAALELAPANFKFVVIGMEWYGEKAW